MKRQHYERNGQRNAKNKACKADIGRKVTGVTGAPTQNRRETNSELQICKAKTKGKNKLGSHRRKWEEKARLSDQKDKYYENIYVERRNIQQCKVKIN